MSFLRKTNPITVFLWLTVISVAVAIYVWWVNVLLTVLLVICASLFLGLLTFALITASADEQSEEDQDEARIEPPPAPRSVHGTDGQLLIDFNPKPLTRNLC